MSKEVTNRLPLHNFGAVAVRPSRQRLETAVTTNLQRKRSTSVKLTFFFGTPGRIRTYDPLFRRKVLLGERGSITSVIAQLRARTNTHVLGFVAVRSSRQVGTGDA
jgi:hypothetical protein